MAATKASPARKGRGPLRKSPVNARQRAIAAGYRSGLEETNAEWLRSKGIEAQYEQFKIPFTPPIKTRTYTPDFRLPNGIIVETKGVFTSADRVKHKEVKAEHPDLDIRFVFSRSATTLTKVSKTTYGAWCQQYGFQYADKLIPQAWLDEPPCPKRIAAFEAVAIPTKTKG